MENTWDWREQFRFQVLVGPLCKNVTLGKSLDLSEMQFFHPSNEKNHLWPVSFQGYDEYDKGRGMWKFLSAAY